MNKLAVYSESDFRTLEDFKAYAYSNGYDLINANSIDERIYDYDDYLFWNIDVGGNNNDLSYTLNDLFNDESKKKVWIGQNPTFSALDLEECTNALLISYDVFSSETLSLFELAILSSSVPEIHEDGVVTFLERLTYAAKLYADVDWHVFSSKEFEDSDDSQGSADNLINIDHSELEGYVSSISEDVYGQDYIFMFSASWCGPCQTFKPVFRNMAKKSPNYKFVIVKVDEKKDVESYAVEELPTFIHMQSGKSGYNKLPKKKKILESIPYLNIQQDKAAELLVRLIMESDDDSSHFYRVLLGSIKPKEALDLLVRLFYDSNPAPEETKRIVLSLIQLGITNEDVFDIIQVVKEAGIVNKAIMERAEIVLFNA